MFPSDFAALENIEYAACADLYRAAPDDVRVAHRIEVSDVGSAMCLTSRGVEPALIFRRAVGLGVRQPASETELDEMVAYMRGLGLGYAIPVAPQSRPAALASWLEGRGFTRAYAWMKFGRACDGVPEATCDLAIRVVGSDLGNEFGRVIVEGFGLPSTVVPWIGALAGRENWVCVMAFSDSTPIAAGAAYVNGGYAWLGLGATLKSHQRQGAQNALLVRRLNEAKARGARVAATETGERLPDKPSQSYRNILRAGFEEMYLRQNYVSPPVE